MTTLTDHPPPKTRRKRRRQPALPGDFHDEATKKYLAGREKSIRFLAQGRK